MFREVFKINITRIEWTDASLNPIVGCTHNCPYCYARKQAKRQKQRCRLCYEFVPHPHLERLEQLNPRQKPRKIFIDSMWDWNADGVKREWLLEIIKKMRECSQHIFQNLSKRPERYARFTYPPNVWLGTSISTTADTHRIDKLLGLDLDNIRFVSIEPIHGPIDHDFTGLDWIIIGAETGNRKGKIIPKRVWISDIISQARKLGIPVFVKDNAKWNEEVREFPGSTSHKVKSKG